MVYAKGTFLLLGLYVSSFRATAYVIDKQSRACRRYMSFCRMIYMCEVLKLQHIYVVGLILISVLKATKHTRLYPVTHYCNRLQGVKERIA